MSDFDRIFDKIEKIDDRLNNIDTSLVRQTVSLEEHIRRTNLLENEIKPVKRHVIMVESVFKFIGAISVVIGTAAALYEIFG
jgi:uncharacterized protein YdcH (DUF465 family)